MDALGALGELFATMSAEARKAALTIAASSRKFTYELYTILDNNGKACGITLGLAAVDSNAKSKSEWWQLVDGSLHTTFGR